jgi:DNA-directed RNA polymerase specialized sigma24 family protein
MTDQDLLRLAARQLPPDLLAVWLQKHMQGTGRRAGSRFLGITQEAWRWRLERADAIMGEALETKEVA